MSQVKAYSKRLKLSGEIVEQAEEYHRLAEVKCSSSLRAEPSLSLVCIELACVKHGEPVDKKQLQRWSGSQPRVYQGSYQMVEKLLNISGQVGIKELVVRFGCFEGEALAEELLKRYRERVADKYSAAQREALDLTTPVFPAAALYCACKLLKIRCDKNKYFGACMSSRAVFQNVLAEMNQCAPSDIDSFKQGKKKQVYTSSQAKDGDMTTCLSDVSQSKHSIASRELFLSRIQSDPTSDTYLRWKDSVLRKARERLENHDSAD